MNKIEITECGEGIYNVWLNGRNTNFSQEELKKSIDILNACIKYLNIKKHEIDTP